jgi:hypothetical protein
MQSRATCTRWTTPLLQPFFWKKLASDEVQATIWSDLPKEILALDLVELEQTFSIAPAKATASKGASSRRPQAITFLDITRSNNIGILLAKLKLPITNISHAILIIDDETLGLDDLKNLSRLLPTSEEVRPTTSLAARKALANLSSRRSQMSRITAFEDVSKLAKPDLYFKEVCRPFVESAPVPLADSQPPRCRSAASRAWKRGSSACFSAVASISIFRRRSRTSRNWRQQRGSCARRSSSRRSCRYEFPIPLVDKGQTLTRPYAASDRPLHR